MEPANSPAASIRSFAAESSAPSQGLEFGLQPNSAFTSPLGRSKRRGPHDLVSMCLLTLVNNFHLVDRESVYALLSKYLWVLWRDVAGCRAHGLEPSGPALHAWESVGGALVNHCQEWLQQEERFLQEPGRNMKISAARYGDDKDKMLYMSMYRLCGAFFNTSNSLDFPLRHESLLDTNLAMLRRATLSCLVHLCLENVERFPRADLVALADLPLTVLELAQYSQPRRDMLLNDLLCHDWGRLAENGGGFSKLRVLRITSRWHRISKDGLMHLRSLPRLILVDINRMWRYPKSSPQPGWKLGMLGRTVFETYASTYLGRPVYASADEAEDMEHIFKKDHRGNADPVMAIRDHGLLRPVDAYKDGLPPGKVAHNGENGLQGGGVAEDDLDSSEDEESGPSSLDHMTFPPALARPWEVFAWLGLVDHKTPDPEDAEKIQLQASNIPLPRNRFVHQRLHNHPSVSSQLEAARLSRVVYRRCPEDDKDGDGQGRD
ncbi:hypothetical protein VTJ49DRAFT_4557 [Mycothermus thermophilus]|uniref:Uncharacterized protein n=1 Tax=Humicola insolens TaxID=85995 RepID=A0ABR3VLL2_HUMIN